MLEPSFVSNQIGRPSFPLKYCLLVTIWKLANNNTFREVSDRFGIAQGTAYHIFVKITRLIAKLKGKVIKFPRSEAAQRQIIEGFENSRCRPLPNTIGCIDGMHIRISKPIKDPISFYNRKGFYSVLVQGVVDSQMKFIDAFVGYPGSCHDAAMWNASPLKEAITNGSIVVPLDNHLIGDGAYALQTYMMVPFKENGFLTECESKYNTALSSTRVFVEQAFGILKKKWRMLNHLELQNIKVSKTIIMASIVLHNIIIDNERVTINDMCEVETDADAIDTAESSILDFQTEAVNKRNRLKNLICA
ncbi:putative nuclease HARBI1 [Condylostylus longicornis]|nr:putative nuclease HARBI1 [Condylostylus longicornis]